MSDSVLYSLLVFSPVSHSSFFPLVVVIILQSICFLHCFMCHFLAIFYIGIIIIASVFFSFSCLHRLLQTAMHCSSNNSYPSHLMTRKRNGLSTKKHSHTKKNVWRICKIKIQRTNWTTFGDERWWHTDKQVTVIVAISIWLNTYQNSNCLVVSVPTSFMVGCFAAEYYKWLLNTNKYVILSAAATAAATGKKL